MDTEKNRPRGSDSGVYVGQVEVIIFGIFLIAGLYFGGKYYQLYSKYLDSQSKLYTCEAHTEDLNIIITNVKGGAVLCNSALSCDDYLNSTAH